MLATTWSTFMLRFCWSHENIKNSLHFFFFFCILPFLSSGPAVAPLPSSVKVLHQDCGAPSAVQEEVAVVDELARSRPSTVTVIHTGTKWRQVPREVSWETTELWGPLGASFFPAFRGCSASPVPQASHRFLPKYKRRRKAFQVRQVPMFFFHLLAHGPGCGCGRPRPGPGPWHRGVAEQLLWLFGGRVCPGWCGVQLVQEVAHKMELTEAAIVFLIFVSSFSSGLESSPEKGQGGCSAVMPCVNINMRLCSALWNFQLQAFWWIVVWHHGLFGLHSCRFVSLDCSHLNVMNGGGSVSGSWPAVCVVSVCTWILDSFKGSVITKAWVPLHYCIGIFIFIQYIVTFCKEMWY